MNPIRTVTDLMTHAAVALSERDVDALLQMQQHVDGWVQGDTERRAQRALLDAMAEAAGELDSLDH